VLLAGSAGTVIDMVQSFTIIAQAYTTPHPAELAQGISTSLTATAIGLVVSAPLIIIGALLIVVGAIGLVRHRKHADPTNPPEP